MDIADSVLDLIGRTPMVRLTRVTEGIACPIVAKVETTNPGGSVKDRPALAMIDAAEKEGLLSPGSTIIEPPISGWPASEPALATPITQVEF